MPRISSHKIRIYRKSVSKIVTPIPIKDLWEKGVPSGDVKGRIYEPEEKKKIFNLNYYLKLRMPYKLVLADIPVQDDERGKIVGDCLMRMVDYVQKNQKKIYDFGKNESEDGNNDEDGHKKAKEGQIRLSKNWEKYVENFSLLKKDRIINSFQRGRLSLENSIQEERLKQAERLKLRKKELEAIIKTVRH